MNAAAALADTAPTTYELCLVPSQVSPTPAPAPRDTFVTKLAAGLAAHCGLDEAELELAELLAYGRSIGAIARTLELDTREVSRRCAALFAATHTDGRQQLFELGLRLTTMTELSAHFMYAR